MGEGMKGQRVRYLTTRRGLMHVAQLAMLVGGAGLVTGCARAGPEEPGSVAYLSIDAVTDRPEDYLSRRITVRGTLKQAWSPQSFELRDHDWIFPESLLVFAPGRRSAKDESNDLDGRDIIVTGMLRRMVVSEVERESDIDLDPAFELEVETRPVLVAERLQPVPAGH
jgi:hypothetical protein